MKIFSTLRAIWNAPATIAELQRQLDSATELLADRLIESDVESMLDEAKREWDREREDDNSIEDALEEHLNSHDFERAVKDTVEDMDLDAKIESYFQEGDAAEMVTNVLLEDDEEFAKLMKRIREHLEHACPGCESMPGDGPTAGCKHKGGCGAEL